MENLNDIKTTIKSIVISRADEVMTLKKLEDDYKEYVGHKIPYLKLGYTHLQYFLESIPDTVILRTKNNLITIHVVSSKNTEHIEEMIRKQKKPRAKCGRSRSDHRLIQQKYLSDRTNYLHPPNFRVNTSFSHTNRYSNQPILYHSGFPGSSFQPATPTNLVQPFFINPLPINNYYYSPSPMPYNYNTGNCYNNMKSTKFKQNNTKSNESKSKQNYNGNILDVSKTTKTKNNNFEYPLNTAGTDFTKTEFQQNNKNSNESKPKQNYPGNILDLSKTTKTKNNNFEFPLNSADTDGKIGEKTKVQNFVHSNSNLVETKSSSNISNLNIKIEKKNYQGETEQKDNMPNLPTKNMQLKEDYLSKIKKVGQNYGTNKKNVSKEKLFHCNDSFASDSVENSKVLTINAAVSILNSELRKEPSDNDLTPLDKLALLASKNRIKYQTESNENKVNIDYLCLDESPKCIFSNKKYNSKTYCNKLNSIAENLENDSNIDGKVNKMMKNQIKKEPAIPKLDYNDILFTLDFPRVENGIATEIPPVEIPDHFKQGAIVKLFVSEVHNPYRFWFNYASQTDYHPLDVLMNEMEHYYWNLDSSIDLKMLKCHICPGSVGVALYANQWHRVEILELAPMDSSDLDEIKVFYVDYGTVSECKMEDLKYLLKKFSELPRQAMRGTMASIRPIGSWSRDATSRFVEEVTDVIVQAKITYLEEDRKISHFIILKQLDDEIESIFGTQSSIVNINNLICEAWDINGNRFATYGPLMINSIHKQHYNHEEHRFPTFELLEMGKYPTYGQIKRFLALTGVDIEKKLFWRSQLENLNIPLRYE